MLPSKNVKHMPAIASTQASVLLQKIDAYPSVTTRLLLLLANTFVRVGELVGMRWDEICSDVWVIPASRMKRRIPHVVPLSTQVKAVLAKLRLLNEGSDLVFESPLNRGQSISKETPINALYRMGMKGEMTAHGFRSLASSVLNERSEFKKEVIERQLAHSETDEVHAAYNRAEYLDQRIKLMQWWSDWLDGQRVQALPPDSITRE